MDKQPRRPLWGRLTGAMRPADPAPEQAQTPLEASPETQVLAARILDVLESGIHPQHLTPEQKTQVQNIQSPFLLMYRRYDITQAYQHWRRNPKDEQARQVWQSLLLGVLTSDRELRDRFNAALPLPEPLWLRSEDVPAPTPAAPTPAPLPEQPAAPAVQPAAAQVGAPDLEHLLRELQSDPEFYKIVFAMRYHNPSLFNLAAALADEPKLSSELYDFFRASDFGNKLVSK
jgi:hypothetical protein